MKLNVSDPFLCDIGLGRVVEGRHETSDRLAEEDARVCASLSILAALAILAALGTKYCAEKKLTAYVQISFK